MNLMRKGALGLAATLLIFLLISLAAAVGILRVVGGPDPVKELLSESGVYDSVISSALDEAKKSSSATSEVSLTDPIIKKAAESSFTSQTIKQATEQVIDGIYAWLDGKTEEPNFKVDLSEAKNTFAAKVAQEVSTRAASLPACPVNYVPATRDPLSLSCLPRGISASQVAQQAETDILNGQGFLEKPVIDVNNFKEQGSSSNVFSAQLKDVPANYQRFKIAPLVLTLLALLVAAMIIFLSTSRRKGMRRTGITLLVVGALMMIFAWGVSQVVNDNIQSKIELDNAVLEVNSKKLLTTVSKSVEDNYWLFGGIYAVLGGLVILLTLFIGKNKKSPKSDPSKSDEEHREPSKPDKSAGKTQTKPKPAKKVILVQ